jgi:hypothetical protein
MLMPSTRHPTIWPRLSVLNLFILTIMLVRSRKCKHLLANGAQRGIMQAPKQGEASMSEKSSPELTGRAKGGAARAAKLTPARRSEIAKKASRARWDDDQVQDAICGSPDNPLRIGDTEIECYVLQDGTRVITQASFLEALGRHRKANVRREGEEQLPAILQGKALSRFLTPEIIDKARPVRFRLPTGGRANGYNAELLPVICELYLTARDAGTLDRQQEHVAVQAEILIRGLARVGIIALVDEATGYEDLRASDALARILEAFIAQELQPYVQTFPPDFYREMFRLRGLTYPDSPVQRPKYFGHLTNDVVYKRLAPSVLAELKKVQQKGETGRPKHKLFQRLTSNVGYPKLREHLGSVVMLMKLSDNWDDFKMKLDRYHPQYGTTMPLPFGETETSTGL